MAKFKNILSNIFSKSSSKLETDAAVIPPRSESNVDDKHEDQSDVRMVPAATTEVVAASDQQQLEPVNPGTLNIVNNVQNNTLTAPQTSITNTAGVQVYQIKNARNVHIGNSFSFTTPNTGTDNQDNKSCANGQQTRKWANLQLSETIKQMMDCDEDLDTLMMDTIARHLGCEWKSFARVLEYSDGQIEAFEVDHKLLYEQIYQFVLDWTRNDDEPTLGKMVKLLWEHKHKETVYHMKQQWKKRRQCD